ncbi:FAD/NAD-P-binding domain-containing protein [Auriscalpium vulgare]|uniref:FAD/NAD-P-binding domain-containing protein n=1 Tax=Auriscalpium vulgare TaxID=40419 RepID=A0ACB8RKK1_9AGAM|nr:FAD/NAD-P-binding domain-containing protein [Auriscalpium vulgare]
MSTPELKAARDGPHVKSVGIIGAGLAGLITAHTLLQDGFADLEILTRDRAVGGVWMEDRVYTGLQVNNLHGEFSFSCFPMSPESRGGRLSGHDLKWYMRKFGEKYLEGKFRFNTEVLNVRRDSSGEGWRVQVRDAVSGLSETLRYARIVLCTGGCSNPRIPDALSPAAAQAAHFHGPVMHSRDFKHHIEELVPSRKSLESVSDDETGQIVVVGGGRSAQDISAYLANRGRKVTMVFRTADAFLATAKPLPKCIRKSRFVSAFSPHSELNTGLERFLHTTWLGSKIVNSFWKHMTEQSFKALKIPADSPLRRAHSPYWSVTKDEGVPDPVRFHAVVNAGKIDLVAPARVERFGTDGQSVVLADGRVLQADAVVLATGYVSSWLSIFDEETREELGLNRHPLSEGAAKCRWDYKSLRNPPSAYFEGEQADALIIRGLVPAKNILRRDFAINGAVITNFNTLTCEVSAHWISSYFLGDQMRIPASVDEAVAQAERNAAWMRRRYPDMLQYLNESYSSSAAFWTWPQWNDDLLADMGLKTRRSGGNCLTWPFKVVRLNEIANLKDERDAKRRSERDLLPRQCV